MERYNLRATSLNDAQLTSELAKRGAQTFGTVKRKQQRLQRFLDAEAHRQEAWTNLRITIMNEQRKVDARTELRRHILLGRAQTGRTSIYQRINEFLGY